MDARGLERFVLYAFSAGGPTGWDETEKLTAASAWRTFRAFFGGEYKYSPMSSLYVYARGHRTPARCCSWRRGSQQGSGCAATSAASARAQTSPGTLFGGFGYAFHIRETPVEFALGGRALYQAYDPGGSFQWDVTQYGPILALGFRF